MKSRITFDTIENSSGYTEGFECYHGRWYAEWGGGVEIVTLNYCVNIEILLGYCKS